MKKHAVVVDCPIETLVNVVKGRCKVNIVLHIAEGKNRFGLLKKSFTVSDKLLSRQLRELEEDRIIVKEMQDNNPLMVTYQVTEEGLSLCALFRQMEEWGRGYSLYRASKQPAV